MRRLEWTTRASADIKQIQRYYHDIDFALGETLFLRIVNAPKPLLERPGLGSPTGSRGLRKWRIKRTPFLLIYRILKDGTIEILRVHHAARDWRPE